MAMADSDKIAASSVKADDPVDKATPRTNNEELSTSEKKRKRFGDNSGKHGSGGKRRDLGRKEYQRDRLDKRSRNELEKEKRQQSDKPSVLPNAFAKDEIDAEEKRPKRKVAVLIGYSGTGYRGMQLSTTERTIEGDLFTAFVKAGAVSKANADDPKKSSLVRCARTDKGVHAAGNMISLKLIVEDEDIVDKINAALSPQIRVWGIERTIGSFSCYQACDSRWYEYLIPTHTLLPPQHGSYLAKVIKEFAEEEGDHDVVKGRQADVEGFWDEVEKNDIKPLLDSMEPDIREAIEKSFYPDWTKVAEERKDKNDDWIRSLADMRDEEEAGKPKQNGKKQKRRDEDEEEDADETEETAPPKDDEANEVDQEQGSGARKDAIIAATKQMKAAYDAARRSYRVKPARIELLQATLNAYLGSPNFHNYTVAKSFTDPSAKRTIRSFVASPKPILINGTEWLSLKVHGQSFMMHQIRKMVGMAVLLVRCGADGPKRIRQSYERPRWPIPKVPGLGLLLERPVFDTYNKNQAAKFGRDPLDFGKYEKAIEEFKMKEIYERIWRQEKEENTFHQFFNHIDNYAQPHFWYLTSRGMVDL